MGIDIYNIPLKWFSRCLTSSSVLLSCTIFDNCSICLNFSSSLPFSVIIISRPRSGEKPFFFVETNKSINGLLFCIVYWYWPPRIFLNNTLPVCFSDLNQDLYYCISLRSCWLWSNCLLLCVMFPFWYLMKISSFLSVSDILLIEVPLVVDLLSSESKSGWLFLSGNLALAVFFYILNIIEIHLHNFTICVIPDNKFCTI